METLLVVDDSTISVMILSRLLVREGFTVLTAMDGLEALSIARNTTVDIILTDLNMPNMNGLELTTALRQLPAYQDTPIFMITSEEEQPIRDEGKRVGVNKWILKPLQAWEVLAAVTDTLAEIKKK